MMVELDLLRYQSALRMKRQGNQALIWDIVRLKWVRFTPEELVRQLVLHHLIDGGYSSRLIQVEKKVLYHGLSRRFDILVYQKDLEPFMLVECKAPQTTISQDAFDQIARYNLSFNVPFLWVTNGKNSYCCQMDYELRTYRFLDQIPLLHDD